MSPFMFIAQFVGGVVIVYLVYLLSLRLMKQDSLMVSKAGTQSAQSETLIIDGFADSTAIGNRTFNTIVSSSPGYVNMPHSFNRKGGSQFSIGFWLFVDDPDAARNKTILLWGDNRPYTAAVFFDRQGQAVANDPNSGTVKVSADGTRIGTVFPVPPDDVFSYPFIACPCITFGDSYDQVAIMFNTVQWPFGTVVVNPVKSAEDDTKRRDAMKLIAHKWALLTFVLEDSVAADDFEDGILVRFYLNDMLYLTTRMPGTLRTNAGNFYMFPDGGIPQTRIANVTYYNYAINQARVQRVYEAGPPKHGYADAASKNAMGDPLYLSEYNKLDIYNT